MRCLFLLFVSLSTISCNNIGKSKYSNRISIDSLNLYSNDFDEIPNVLYIKNKPFNGIIFSENMDGIMESEVFFSEGEKYNQKIFNKNGIPSYEIRYFRNTPTNINYYNPDSINMTSSIPFKLSSPIKNKIYPTKKLKIPSDLYDRNHMYKSLGCPWEGWFKERFFNSLKESDYEYISEWIEPLVNELNLKLKKSKIKGVSRFDGMLFEQPVGKQGFIDKIIVKEYRISFTMDNLFYNNFKRNYSYSLEIPLNDQIKPFDIQQKVLKKYLNGENIPETSELDTSGTLGGPWMSLHFDFDENFLPTTTYKKWVLNERKIIENYYSKTKYPFEFCDKNTQNGKVTESQFKIE